MLFRVQRQWLYLSSEDVRTLEAEIFGPDGQRSLALELFGPEHDWLSIWHRVAVAAHRRLTLALEARAAADHRAFWRTTADFSFTNGLAADNVLDLLHAYSLATRSTAVHPLPRSLAEDIHNRMSLGKPWAHLFGDTLRLDYRLWPRTVFERLVTRNFHSSCVIRSHEVTTIRGSLKHFALQIRGITIRFDDAVSFQISNA